MTAATRRTVLQSAALTCGAGLLGGCGGGGARPEVAAPGGGPAAELATPGGSPAAEVATPGAGAAADVAATDGGVLVLLADVPVGGVVAATAPDGTKVLVAQPTAGTAVAFSSVCTHEGCTVVPEEGGLSCPCHGSQFDPATGEVRRGPAGRPLAPYAVQVEDGKVVPA